MWFKECSTDVKELGECQVEITQLFVFLSLEVLLLKYSKNLHFQIWRKPILKNFLISNIHERLACDFGGPRAVPQTLLYNFMYLKQTKNCLVS